jgi:hypothetical protein
MSVDEVYSQGSTEVGISSISIAEGSQPTTQQATKILDHHTFSMILDKARRKDLSKEIHTVFDKKVDEAMHRLSQYTVDFQTLIYSFMFSIKNIRLARGNSDNISFIKSQGFKTLDIFPEGFKLREDINYSSNPIPHDIVNSEKLCSQLDLLFQQQHL